MMLPPIRFGIFASRQAQIAQGRWTPPVPDAQYYLNKRKGTPPAYRGSMDYIMAHYDKCAWCGVGLYPLSRRKLERQRQNDLNLIKRLSDLGKPSDLIDALLSQRLRLRIHDMQARLQLAVDHLRPKSAGGLRKSENLIPACNICNPSRGNIPVIEHLLPGILNAFEYEDNGNLVRFNPEKSHGKKLPDTLTLEKRKRAFSQFLKTCVKNRLKTGKAGRIPWVSNILDSFLYPVWLAPTHGSPPLDFSQPFTLQRPSDPEEYQRHYKVRFKQLLTILDSVDPFWTSVKFESILRKDFRHDPAKQSLLLTTIHELRGNNNWTF